VSRGAAVQALQYASESLRNNMDVVLAAVRKRAASLQFASPQLQNDLTVVLTAIAPSLQIRRCGRLHHNVSSDGRVDAASDTASSAVTPCAEAVASSGSSAPDCGEASGRLGGTDSTVAYSDISGDDGSAPGDTDGALASPADAISSPPTLGDDALWHLGYWHVSQPQPDTRPSWEVPLTKLELKCVGQEWEPENRGFALTQVVIFRPYLPI
jgi:hypothetical protein